MEKKKIACPGCSILCDDIFIELENGKIEHVLNACSKGYAKFNKITKNRLDESIINKFGIQKKVDFEQSIQMLKDFIKESKRPLFLIGNKCTIDDIKEIFQVAENVNGIVACPSSQSYLKFMKKLKKVGIEIPTYKEMIDFVDTMVFWGTNPSATHLRHASKFSVLTRGEKITKGKEDRFVVMVDIRKTEIRVLTDEFIQLEINQDNDLIAALMEIANEKELNSLPFNFPLKDLINIHKFFMKSDEIVIFIGDGFLGNSPDTIDKFIDLVLIYKNKGVNIKILPMVENFGINNYISLVLEEYDGKTIIDFRDKSEIIKFDYTIIYDIDLVLYLNFDPIESIPIDPIKEMLKKKSVYLGPRKNWISMITDLAIPTSEPLIESHGTVKRLDFLDVNQDIILQFEKDLKSISDILKNI
ncbi:MAG: hypothetical protein EAX96_02615 [Candidatus Lokiarchaeota archaeon]|nr:hypothetical protein [Candidatus Lokiarchaeota archaeon]